MLTRFTGTPPCPQCGAKLDAAVGWQGALPTAGDLAVCGHCAALLQFINNAGCVAPLAPHEFAALPADDRRRLLRAMDMIRAVQHHLRKARNS